MVHKGLISMLGQYPDIKIVAEAADGVSALRMTRKLTPDVILMDVGMPVMDGMEATRIISSEFPNIRIIGLSMYVEKEQAAAMIAAGASAYFTKDGDTDRLISAIREKGKNRQMKMWRMSFIT